MGRTAPRLVALGTAFLLLLVAVSDSSAFSLLTHEEIVDILWKDHLQPKLLERFPSATPEQLRKAHGFAYGGCLVADMGYYPFGNKFFSDLAHYVRTGDFVENLIQEATNLNEYAFGLGALAHHTSDTIAHPTINRVVAHSFPKLHAKFGDEVTYADSPKSHIRVEFGFDLVQVAKNRYSSDRYHDFIGFEIAKHSLERAFSKTYGLELRDVIPHLDLALSTFRHAVSEVVPEMTRVALATKRAEIVKEAPDYDIHKFRYYLSRSAYEKEWGHDYQKPGIVARAIALFTRVVPKVGPFKALAFKIPDPDSEKNYIRSVNDTVENCARLLKRLDPEHVHFANLDLDTGRQPRLGEYALSDKTHGRLLDELAKKDFVRLTPELRKTFDAFYAQGRPARVASRKERKVWQKTLKQINSMSAMNASRGPVFAGPIPPGHKPPAHLER